MTCTIILDAILNMPARKNSCKRSHAPVQTDKLEYGYIMIREGCSSKHCAMSRLAETAGFNDSDIRIYKHHCKFKTYNQGENIYLQNSEPSGIYCLQSGYVMLWHRDDIGNEIGFRVVGSDDIFGHRAFFGENPHTATAVALTNCAICHHYKKSIDPLLEKYPSLSKLFLRLVALDRGPPDSLLLRNTHLSVKLRLINLLLILKRDFAKQHLNGKLVFELPLYRKDISTMIAARHETITRAIRELHQDDLAHFHRRTVVVPDIERLKDAAKKGG